MKKDMLQENRRALLTEEDYEAMLSWGEDRKSTRLNSSHM